MGENCLSTFTHVTGNYRVHVGISHSSRITPLSRADAIYNFPTVSRSACSERLLACMRRATMAAH
jgi:hypothetical protein